MRFGVNYTPRVGWFHHWLDFNPGEVARDFDTIADLGADHVRVFPLWPVFQPNPSFISPTALDRLDKVIQLAGESGLDVSVDGLQGHLSSFDFLPAWLLTWHRRNMFVDERAIAATATYIETISRVSAQHDNAFAITVGNEVNQFSGGVHPDPHAAAEDDISAWLQTMLRAIRVGAPGLLALHSCDDDAWYDDRQPFTVGHVAREGDMSVVHSWVFNGTAQRFGPEAFETRAHARYLMEVARAFHLDDARPIWLQEVGAPRNVLPEASVEGFIEATVAQVAAAPDVFGITWWSSHDVARSLADYPELEYDLGLIDEHGRIKREGKILRSAIARARTTPPDLPATEMTLDLMAVGGRSGLAVGGQFWTDYMDEARRSGHPRVRLATAENTTALSA